MTVLNRKTVGVPEGAVYIGRGSVWGNPFVMGVHGNRDEVCVQYERYLWNQIKSGEVSLEKLAGLANKDLVCFCAPLRCHGDTLQKASLWALKQIQY